MNVAAQTVVTFTAGTTSYYTVPSGVFTLTVDAQGGAGGTSSSSSSAVAGKGGRVQATLNVIPGSVLQLNVGGQGDIGNFCCTPTRVIKGGYNGGGDGLDYGGGGGGAGLVDAVEFLSRGGFAGEVAELGDGGLHAPGEFIVRDGGFHMRVVLGGGGKAAVHRADEVEAFALRSEWLLRADVFNGFGLIDLDDGGLMLGWKVSIAEQADAAMRNAGTAALQYDVARKISRLGAEAVAGPRSGAGIADEGKAAVHEEIALRMLAELRSHAADHAELVRHRGHVRKKVAHRQAGLAVALVGPVCGLDGAVVVELRLLHRTWHWLPSKLRQHRLVIEGIDMRHASTHVEENDAACLRCEFLRAMHKRHVCERLLLHEACKSGHAEAGGGAGEELAAGEIHIHFASAG